MNQKKARQQEAFNEIVQKQTTSRSKKMVQQNENLLDDVNVNVNFGKHRNVN